MKRFLKMMMMMKVVCWVWKGEIVYREEKREKGVCIYWGCIVINLFILVACIFICNKICWYAWQSSLPSSSSSSLQANPLGTNPHSFLSPQSFHPISLSSPSFLSLSLSHSRFNPPQRSHLKCTPHPKKSLGTIMAAVTESIKVVLMRLNCRLYCRRWPL